VFHSEDSTATVRDLQRLADGALAVRV
jgi:hypothetical protein